MWVQHGRTRSLHGKGQARLVGTLVQQQAALRRKQPTKPESSPATHTSFTGEIMADNRVFKPTDRCPFKDCNKWNNCVGAWHRKHPGVFVPDIDIEHGEGVSGATFTGGDGGEPMVICYS